MGGIGVEPIWCWLKASCTADMPTTRTNETARVGVEPTTLRLTVGCSAIELSGINPLPKSRTWLPFLGGTGLHPAGKGKVTPCKSKKHLVLSVNSRVCMLYLLGHG